jgi:TetR/AcrR family transcriptional repressor of nem operon
MPDARCEHTSPKVDPLVTTSGPSRAAPAGAPSGIGAAFRSCESYLTAGLRQMQDRGELDAGTAHGVLAPGLMAAYQGGYPLSQAARSSRPMAVALDLALDSIEARRARSDRASEAAS